LWDSARLYVEIAGVYALVVGIIGVSTLTFPPVWALVPIALLFLYGLMKVNYEEFRNIERVRDELRKGETTRKKRIELKDALANSSEEGQRLYASDPTAEAAEEWVNDTADLIRAALGDGEVHVFVSAPGITLHSGNKTHQQLWIEGRLHRLSELIARVDSLDLHPDFDPQDWTNQE
jgi:hypothetical protein